MPGLSISRLPRITMPGSKHIAYGRVPRRSVKRGFILTPAGKDRSPESRRRKAASGEEAPVYRYGKFVLATLIAAVLFLSAIPAQSATRHRHRAHKTRGAATHRTTVPHTTAHPTVAHPKAAHPTAAHPKAVHPESAHPKANQASGSHPKAVHPSPQQTPKDRRSALEEQTTTPGIELARLPLEHFRDLPPLRGSRESLLRQNERADEEGLSRITDDAMLMAMVRSGALAPIPVSPRLIVDERLEPERRYCRPWTARFLADLARQYYARFHSPLKVDSAVRTVAYQKHLLLVNGNAAPAEGDTRSPHLTGEAVDIGKKGLSSTEIGWMRAYLLPLEAAGKLDVEEEFEQACFHISVYESYVLSGNIPPSPPLRTAPRPRRRRTTSLLATHLP